MKKRKDDMTVGMNILLFLWLIFGAIGWVYSLNEIYKFGIEAKRKYDLVDDLKSVYYNLDSRLCIIESPEPYRYDHSHYSEGEYK